MTNEYTISTPPAGYQYDVNGNMNWVGIPNRNAANHTFSQPAQVTYGNPYGNQQQVVTHTITQEAPVSPSYQSPIVGSFGSTGGGSSSDTKLILFLLLLAVGLAGLIIFGIVKGIIAIVRKIRASRESAAPRTHNVFGFERG